ncbi:TetR family transcriptional regulator [Humitalea sp. 24SJ18S-53]|uniref:TetR family transcriptional regulator n=1 Tax=Humitalea sp. 24SJ18S-53 TaxID=3422307 RepID=UPI003D66C5BC
MTPSDDIATFAAPPYPGTPLADAALLEALWRVVAAEGWRGATIEAIAAEAGVSAAGLRARFPIRALLLARHASVVDRVVIDGTIPDGGGSPRERVFDVLMRRFDALQPGRAGILRLMEELPRDPLTALAIVPLLPVSMARMAEAAGIAADGALGAVRVNGMAGVWLAAMRAWRKDDSVDLSATMAALDKALDRAEGLARSLRLPDGDRMTLTAEPIQP